MDHRRYEGITASLLFVVAYGGVALKPSQGKLVRDGTKCFPVTVCLIRCDWANCLRFGIFSVGDEGRVLLSPSIFRLMFPTHFTDITFLNIKMSCVITRCI